MEKDLLFEPDDFSVDGDDEDEVDQTISAIAPVVTLQEVLNSEVTSSPAFQILEEVISIFYIKNFTLKLI